MAYKPKPIKTTVGAAIADAFSEIETLAGEMRETYDNMESANMSHMPKCEAAGEAADELEQHTDEPDVPEELAEIEVEATEMVNKDKRKGASRDVRLSNATALLTAAKDTLEGLDEDAIKEILKAGGVTKTADEIESDAEALAQALDEHCDISVEFPGMFG